MNPIRHLIILTMENRSFDHYLGALTLEGRADINGLPTPLPTNPDNAGNLIPAWPMDGTPPGYPDPPHGWEPAHTAYNGGLNDRFVNVYQNKHGDANLKIPMGYYTRQTLPVYYSLADTFTVCDAWFCSVLSSTWPNLKYLHSGHRDADNDTHTLPAFPGFGTQPYYDFLEDQPDPDNPGRKLTWKYYVSDLPFLALWYRFAANHANHNFVPVSDFLTDCREDRLPTVSVINPPVSLADDHPSKDPRAGQKFVGLIVDALTHSESWATSALLILYDENGGFYDHVPPPPCFEDPPSEDNPLGFRVPAMVVSPYAKRRFACHTVFDHTSVMKSISERWGVMFGPEYGRRWSKAPGIWDSCFDFTQQPLKIDTYTGDPILDINWGSQTLDLLTAEVNAAEALLERIFLLRELKPIDHRARTFDWLTALEQGVISLKRLSSS